MLHARERAHRMLDLALIVAVAKNGVIGRDGGLPWRFPEDLRRFRALTMGHSLIMGRRTWNSLPRALPGRQNIVVTRKAEFVADGATIAHSLSDALGKVSEPPPAFCIGGGELFRDALPRATIAYVTHIDADFDGDATFSPLDAREWRETQRESHAFDATLGFAYAFLKYERVALHR